MGAFLSKPVTDTYPFDDTNGKYAYGSSSMQGYRTSQEDAHMCLLDFDTDTCLFGVFDGHGGSEVAQYTSKKFPEFLKNNEYYKKADYERALREAFIEFDASLVREEVYQELKDLIAKNNNMTSQITTDEEDEDLRGENDLNLLKEESQLPLHELINRFQSGRNKERLSKTKARESIQESISSCSSTSKQDVSSTDAATSPASVEEDNEAGCSSSTVSNDEKKNEETSTTKETAQEDQPSSSGEQSEAASSKSASTTTVVDQQPESSSTEEAESSSTEPKKKKRITPNLISPSASTFLQMLDEIDDEEDSDDDSMLGDEDSEDGDEFYDESDEEEDEESDESDEESDEEEESGNDGEKKKKEKSSIKLNENPFKLMFSDEGPGRDSGCTAVICLLKDNKLYVANAGDSRAVLCRGGKAIEMSEDHKPTSEIEYKRIKKAGGKVTQDGRVNGGLNLSRAFGDHSYKTNKDLPLEEQMISALPDIRTIDLIPEDEFIVIACDGIWNSMNSEEVVEYINEELKKEKTLSKICDSLFFKCLAEDTRGDGSGCDNQTCIIIKLKDLPPKTDNGVPNENEVESKVDTVVAESNGEEEKLNGDSKHEIKIENELSETNGKRKHELANELNGNEPLVTESPSNKKLKSDLE